MDFIGSKVKLLNWIFRNILSYIDNSTEDYIFLDACSGTGSVSRYAANLGFKVISNDIMKFSSSLVNGSIGLSVEQLQEGKSIIQFLNEKIEGIEGYFYKNFSDISIPPRPYFTSSNASLIDSIRKYIDEIKDPKVRDYIIYCTIEALSRVSNTTGVQAAFLKKLKERALNKITLQPEEITSGDVVTYSKDIISLLNDDTYKSSYKEDIIYIDPPYNTRQYGPNYHLYETFVLDDNPTPKGVTGLRDWENESKSDFCSKRKCLEYLQELVSITSASHIFLSYNSDGVMKIDDILELYPDSEFCGKKQKRYKSDSSSNRKYNESTLVEYLIYLRK